MTVVPAKLVLHGLFQDKNLCMLQPQALPLAVMATDDIFYFVHVVSTVPF